MSRLACLLSDWLRAVAPSFYCKLERDFGQGRVFGAKQALQASRIDATASELPPLPADIRKSCAYNGISRALGCYRRRGTP
jgi:hypothetical protein